MNAKTRREPEESIARAKCGRPKVDNASAAPSDSWQKRLEQYLAQHALNQSESRNKLVEAIFAIRGHFSARDLINQLAESNPQIGAATVYRNLPLLLDAGILRETLTDESGQKIFELAAEDHHDHIVCLDCGQIFEFHDEGIETAQDKVTSKLGFAPVRHKHVIFAHCTYSKKKR